MIYLIGQPIIPYEGIYVHHKLSEMQLSNAIKIAQSKGEFQNFIANEQYCRGLSQICDTHIAPPLKGVNGDPAEPVLPEIKLEDGDQMIIVSIMEMPPNQEYPTGSAHVTAVQLTHFNDTEEGLTNLIIDRGQALANAEALAEIAKRAEQSKAEREEWEQLTKNTPDQVERQRAQSVENLPPLGTFTEDDIQDASQKGVFFDGTEIHVSDADVNTPWDKSVSAYSNPICRAMRSRFHSFTDNIYQVRSDRCAVHFYDGAGYTADKPLPLGTLRYSTELSDWMDRWHDSWETYASDVSDSEEGVNIVALKTDLYKPMTLIIREIEPDVLNDGDEIRRWELRIKAVE